MKPICLTLLMTGGLPAAGLTLTSPVELAVVQRAKANQGTIMIAGSFTSGTVPDTGMEARIIDGARQGTWQKLTPSFDGSAFRASMEVAAGGWYRLEVRASADGRVFADAAVGAVGVGEVFVVAGQSNSANHGEEKQISQSGRVAAFDGGHWRMAHDPQPGASGEGGSFIPPFGDAMAEKFRVPVGIISCGIGATSVREWLPEGSRFPQPPTLTGRVRRASPEGEWESNGEAFGSLLGRMGQLGPQGFRAVLWHQGESDANQQDPGRTLPGLLYRKYLEQIILESRRRVGWKVPWFIAQASYHVPGDEASPEIRAAQASLWKDGVALAGPDTDALKGNFRDNGGKGVHFSGPGLREHAARWMEKVAPWVEAEVSKP